MLAVFQVQQRPHLGIAPQDHMTAPTAVTSIRTTLRRRTVAVHVRAARATLSGAAAQLHIVNEILARHGASMARRTQESPSMAVLSRPKMSSMVPVPTIPAYLS